MTQMYEIYKCNICGDIVKVFCSKREELNSKKGGE